MQARYYQEDAVTSVWDYFCREIGNPLIAMPTGTGKSIVIGMLVKKIMTSYPGQRVLKLTHRQELIEQNYKKLLQLWPTAPAGIYSAGLKRKEIMPITYAGIGSVAKKAKSFGHIDLVIVDEAHMIPPKGEGNYLSFIAELKAINPMLKVIGLTATPYRLGQGRLIDAIIHNDEVKTPLFTHICYDLTSMKAFNRLVEEGYLARLIPRKTYSEIDVSEVHMAGGEFIERELQAAADREEVTRKACDEICYFGQERNCWLIFATGIQHAKHVAEELKSRGVDAHAIDSKMNPEERTRLIADFKAGKVRCLVNNDILTTGLDVPQIDLIAVLRPTMSPGLWVQILGRGTRPAEGKEDCMVLDFAGNTRRLGPINDPVMPRRKGQREGGTAPIKVCEACGTYNHASVPFCISCDQEFPKHVKFAEHASEQELMRDDKPQVEVFPVSNVTYQLHTPRDNRPPSLKVTYFSGLRMFSEWVCFEHEGFALHKAHDWWRARVDIEDEEKENIPQTVEEAKERIGECATPTHIRVWVNKKHPEIKAHDFTGTAFGTVKVTQE